MHRRTRYDMAITWLHVCVCVSICVHVSMHIGQKEMREIIHKEKKRLEVSLHFSEQKLSAEIFKKDIMRCILLSKEQKYNCSAFSLFGDSAFAITHLLKCICKFKMDTHGLHSFVDLCRAVKHWSPLGFLPHAPSQDQSGNTLPSGFSSQTGMTRGWRRYPGE